MSWQTLAVRLNPDDVGVPKVSAENAFNGVLGTVYLMAGIVCVVVIIIAGILYAISNGEPEKTKRARYAIIYGVVGMVVILMAFVITNFIIGRF